MILPVENYNTDFPPIAINKDNSYKRLQAKLKKGGGVKGTVDLISREFPIHNENLKT